MSPDTNPSVDTSIAPLDSEIDQHQFRWHQLSALLNPNGQNSDKPPVLPTIVGGVHFIEDVNCESTLRAIQLAIEACVEFCVHAKLSGRLHTGKTTTGVQLDQSQAYLQCMSSGSNGKPKRVRRTHSSWINSFCVTKKNSRLSTSDSYAIVGSLSHSLALYAALEAVWIGADVHALANLRPDKQLLALEQLGSSVLYATPTQLRILCHRSEHRTSKNSKLKHIFCGGGKLDEHTRSLIESQFPDATIKEFYGASETSFISMSDATTPIDSVGKLYPNVQLLIKPVDVNDYPSVQTQENPVGEIWVKSPYLFSQYAEGCDADMRWQDGFVCIGEMGYTDNNANLYLTGRRSRMINIADNIVFPEQIEHFLNAHESVHHCAVIPTHDKRRGSVLIAIIEASESSTLRTQLLKQCRYQFGALKAPRRIMFVKQLPMLASGKPDIQNIAHRFSQL